MVYKARHSFTFYMKPSNDNVDTANNQQKIAVQLRQNGRIKGSVTKYTKM